MATTAALPQSQPSRIPLDDTTAWMNVITWARTAGRGLLYVDDNQALLEMTSRAFERVGASCSTAATHDEGVEVLARNPEIQVAIVDFDMPDGDVGELVRRLHAVRSDLVVVGTGTGDRRQEFAYRGVQRFVSKPWRILDLVLAVDT